MALTNEQYDALMRSYNQKQMRNNEIVTYRTKELYSAIPALSALDDEVSRVSISSISAIFDGQDAELIKAESAQKLSAIKSKRTQLIVDAGFPFDYLEPPYDCPDCKDTGYINGSRCHCFKQAAINLVYSQSNVNTIFSRENFDNFDINLYDDDYYNESSPDSARVCAQKAYETATNFVQNFKREGGNLMLLGQTGCGKTFLSNCIAKALLDDGVSVIYFTSYELFQIFEQQTFKKDSDAEDISNQIFDCDLLIIDDLGTEFTNSFTNSKLFHCLNERLLKNKSIIISTNLSPNELAERYSDRILSRIFSKFKFIQLIGRDIRVKTINN